MGLFVQNITLRLSDENYVVEKVALPQLSKDKIDLVVLPGTIALVGGVKYKGQEVPYKLSRSIVGTKKTQTEVYLFPDKKFDGVTVSFFGGQHVVSISSLPTAKAKFSIVGTASVEISDYKAIAEYYARSIKKDELVDDINKNVRAHLSNEVSVAASKYIRPDTTEITLRAALDDVVKEVMNSRKTSSVLMNMGLMLSSRGLSMHINALDDAEDKLKAINDALTDKAIESLDYDMLDRIDDELAAARKHEIDVIRARRTDISESTDTRNINTNTNGGNVVINNVNAGGARNGKKFCPNCGAKLTGSGRFCPDCGAKL